jgi:hypothetical protein
MAPAASSSPVLSVVVVALDGGENLARCLKALSQQQNPPAMEILVAHDHRLDEPGAWPHRFPQAQFVFCPYPRNYPAMRAAGVRATRGSIVAATEDQCIPPPAWCANIVAAHAAQSAAAIGGPVEKRRPDSLLNWAVYLREFGEYTPPLPEGVSATLTDCNVTYKRAALDAIVDVWRLEFHEPQVHGALLGRGETLWLSAGLHTEQQRSLRLGFALRERYAFGRLFGRLRLCTLGVARRVLLILASPLLPLLLTARVLGRAVRKGKYLGVTLLALPYLLLLSAAWVLGEFVSYLAGKKESPARKS